MMGRFIRNETASPMFVGGRLIPAFDGRWFENSELPSEFKPEVAAPVLVAGPSIDEQLQELRAGNVKVITDALPGLTFEALERLAGLESSDASGRKTLLQAIDAEKLRRASEQLDAEQLAAREQALHAARNELLSARLAVQNLPQGSIELPAAEARVAEAQAKVDALAPAAA